MSLQPGNMPGVYILILLFSLHTPMHPATARAAEWLRPPVTHPIPDAARWLQSEFGVQPRPVRRKRLELLLAALR